jgi:hypothetical protein
MRLFIALVAVLAFSGIAEAGPIRDRLKARFGCQSCAPCSSSAASVPAYLPEPKLEGKVVPVAYSPSAAPAFAGYGSSCPGGVCPAPSAPPRIRVFPIR